MMEPLMVMDFATVMEPLMVMDLTTVMELLMVMVHVACKMGTVFI